MILIIALNIATGPAHLAPRVLWRALFVSPHTPDVAARILWLIRIPRGLVAMMTGATLALSGLLLQRVTRNPLADPYLFGLSSGAAAGAVAAIVWGGDILGLWTPIFGASTGGFVATLLLCSLIVCGARGPGIQSERLILGGLAISFFFSTLTQLFVFAGDRNTAQTILFWTMGSFTPARWEIVPIVASGFGLIYLYCRLRASSMDALTAGEDTARSLGVPTARLRLEAIFICCIGCSASVATCGPIPFIGLIVPHLVRNERSNFIGANLTRVAFGGAFIATAADCLAHRLFAQQELPVGILISALGSGFLVNRIWRAQR